MQQHIGGEAREQHTRALLAVKPENQDHAQGEGQEERPEARDAVRHEAREREDERHAAPVDNKR